MFDDDDDVVAPNAIIPVTPAVEAWTIGVDAAGERLDRWLVATRTGLTRSRIEGLIAAGHITINDGIPKKSGVALKPGDQVVLTLPPLVPTRLEPEAIPLDIVFADEHLAIINKPSGLVVHPGAGHETGTLVHALLHWARERGLPLATGTSERPGIVHRIDKDTSGLMVVALTEVALTGLQALFQVHALDRVYRTITIGTDRDPEGTIRSTHARDPRDRKRFTGRTGSGRHAVTHWRTVERGSFLGLVECRLETGRTHQIRMHLSEKGTPIVADPIYGQNLPPRVHDARIPGAAEELRAARAMQRLALHAAVLGFRHPVTQAELHFHAPDPGDFRELLASFAPAIHG